MVVAMMDQMWVGYEYEAVEISNESLMISGVNFQA